MNRDAYYFLPASFLVGDSSWGTVVDKYPSRTKMGHALLAM